MEDIRSRSEICRCLEQQTINTDTTTTGETIDLVGREAVDLCFDLEVTAGTAELRVYEGDESDMSDEALASDDFIIGEDTDNTSATGEQVIHVGYVGNKRYIRPKIVSASSANFKICGIAYKSKTKHCPTV